MKEPIMEKVAAGRVRHWHSEGPDSHCPYSGQLHDVITDERIGWVDLVREKLEELPEGTVASVHLRVNLKEEPDQDDYWTLLEPHEYGHAKDRKP